MTTLLNELSKDDVVDRKLAKLIMQNAEPSHSGASIKRGPRAVLGQFTLDAIIGSKQFAQQHSYNFGPFLLRKYVCRDGNPTLQPLFAALFVQSLAYLYEQGNGFDAAVPERFDIPFKFLFREAHALLLGDGSTRGTMPFKKNRTGIRKKIIDLDQAMPLPLFCTLHEGLRPGCAEPLSASFDWYPTLN